MRENAKTIARLFEKNSGSSVANGQLEA
jgi:hypothetical protein